MTNQSCRVAIIQHPPVFLNLEASTKKAVELLAAAATDGAQIVVFPETWLPGYPVWLDEAPDAARWDHPPAQALYQTLVENAMTIPGPQAERLRKAAERHGVFLVMGVHERRKGTLYNTTLFLSPQGERTIHRKLMPTYTERLIWGMGDGSTLDVMDTPWGRLGGLVCWEHWMPLARAAMHAQQESIHVAQWPTVKEMHQIASRHYAFEGQCFVLASGTVLSLGDVLAGFDSLDRDEPGSRELLASMGDDEGKLLQRGGSAVIGPDGGYIAGPVFDQPAILHAQLDLSAIHRGHLVLDTDGHYARPDVFRLEVNDLPQQSVVYRSQQGEKEK